MRNHIPYPKTHLETMEEDVLIATLHGHVSLDALGLLVGLLMGFAFVVGKRWGKRDSG
jgi:hypothetical protein